MSDAAPSPPPRWVVLGLAALTLLVVTVASLALFRDDLEPVDDPDDAAVTTVEPRIVADDFERPDADALADADHPWAEGTAAWAVQDGHATLTAVDGVPAVAVLPSETAGAVARVTATAVEPGWAFAVRVQDERNFWALVARPDAGSWSLAVVEDGEITDTPGFLPVAPADGARIEVALAGPVLRVTIGDTTNEVSDETFADATGIGLATFSPENLVSMAWDDVELARS